MNVLEILDDSLQVSRLGRVAHHSEHDAVGPRCLHENVSQRRAYMYFTQIGSPIDGHIRGQYLLMRR